MDEHIIANTVLCIASYADSL